MRKTLFAVMFIVVAFVASPSAYARFDEPAYYIQDVTDPCPTYESCTLTDGTSTAPKKVDVPCPAKGSTCETCKANCDCEYKKAENKCNGGILCIQKAGTEHRACLGNCFQDTLEVC